ncbi:MAG: PIG-L family deacetylase [Ruminococcaceae bacterium]|nr:PIG-L family deacetylase [Oscillospiraceae bacterium]
MNYLVVVAHPDDEVLGAGATIKKLSSDKNNKISVCIMSTQAQARNLRPSDSELENDMNSSLEILGVSQIFEGDFPNIKMNTTPHLSLVQFIEKAILESEPDVIITHHPSDTNNDHLHTSLACQAAIRIFQRRNDIKPLTAFLFMEVLSSTEWAVNSSLNKFNPNVFFEVGKAGIEAKIKALSQYRGVMREYPHPRSVEAIQGLAAYRGAQSGCNYAESFECVFRRCL